ncbi:MAG: competence protein ComE [Candidatus Harrisonbacteria bacterium]|nr:competence protein ComE [Candidatus Harrisonbacteria bacterium]
MVERPSKLSKNEFFDLLAALFSSLSSCFRLMTGTVFSKNKRIVAAGYNGPPAGIPNCEEVGHRMIDGHCITIHGEKNAEMNALTDLNGGTSHTIGTPCIDCVNTLLQAGITRIRYIGSYNNSKGKEYIEELCCLKGVPIIQVGTDGSYTLGLLRRVIDRLRGEGGIFHGLPDECFDFRQNEENLPKQLC